MKSLMARYALAKHRTPGRTGASLTNMDASLTNTDALSQKPRWVPMQKTGRPILLVLDLVRRAPSNRKSARHRVLEQPFSRLHPARCLGRLRLGPPHATETVCMAVRRPILKPSGGIQSTKLAVSLQSSGHQKNTLVAYYRCFGICSYELL